MYKLENIVETHRALTVAGSVQAIDEELMRRAKRMGFADVHIASLVNSDEAAVRAHRKSLGVIPFVKRIDTLAAEFPAYTNYLYTTYNASEHDVEFDEHGTMVLGSGVYRIGSSVEFDWCAVTCARSLRDQGVRTIMVNYNPETVSTDFDEADRLYFEELGWERVMDIFELEGAQGVVVSVGGMLLISRASALPTMGQVNCHRILHYASKRAVSRSSERTLRRSTWPRTDTSSLRSLIRLALTSLGGPKSRALTPQKHSRNALGTFCIRLLVLLYLTVHPSYPVLIRPSYVLSGAAMNVVYEEPTLEYNLSAAASVSPLHPVVITKFIDGAQEIDVDAVAHRGRLLVHAVSEHVENAGVHSGDATVSKVLGHNFIETAAAAITGVNVPEPVDLMAQARDYTSVKVAQFSWTRLGGADPFLGVGA